MSAENTPDSEAVEPDYTPYPHEDLSLREIDAMQDDVLSRLDQLNADILQLIDTVQGRLTDEGDIDKDNAKAA